MEEPNREEIKAMIEITDANRLPYDLNELRTKVINWREVTNDFDFYTIRDIINRWSDDNEQRIVARIIGSNMGVDKIKGIPIDYLKAAANLTCMYKYKPGTENRKNMEKYVMDLEEQYRIQLIKDLKSYKKGLTAQVEKLKSDLENEKVKLEAKTKESEKWEGLYEAYEKKIEKLAADLAEKERENKVLTQKNKDMHKKNPTADDFVKRLVREAKKLYKHDKGKLEVIRQMLYNLGCVEAEAELDACIEGKEYKPMNIEGDYVVNKNVENEVNGVAKGATGIITNK